VRYLIAAVVAVGPGCGFGLGAMGAANRPLIGHQGIPDRESGVECSEVIDSVGPASYVSCYAPKNGRCEYWERMVYSHMECGAYDRDLTWLQRMMEYGSLGGGIKRGTVDVTADGSDRSETLTEFDLTGWAHVLSNHVGLSVGLTGLVALEGKGTMTGYGFRGSLSPLPLFSVDAAYTWVDGDFQQTGGGAYPTFSGTRSSFGGTIMLFGRRTYRLALAIAYTTTDGGPYQSSGYTYQLVSTFL